MEIVKKTAEYEIVKKRSGRYGVRGADRKWVNGDEKVKILLAEKLIKAAPPKEKEAEAAPEEAAPAEAAPDEAATEEAAEGSDEDTPAEPDSQS